MKFIPAVVLICLLSACNNTTDHTDTDPEIAQPVVAAPANILYSIVAHYPHDRGAYTQGLELHNGKMYEGTGDYEKSALRITDYKTGTVEKNHPIGSKEIFGEGITIFNNKIYQLTWQSHLVYVYDVKDITKPIKTFNWPYEGWGITHNDKELIISTGVNPNLYFVDPETFKVNNILPVADNKGPVLYLNELEYINGFIYANIWKTNNIVKINPETGKVVGNMDFTGVIKQYAPDFIPVEEDEVLNGIAWDSTTKTMFVTGKRWPKMFEIKLN